VPDWYLAVRAARWAGISLQAWHRLPLLWQNHYRAAMGAEGAARAELDRFLKSRREGYQQ
jgi:hypothetical protein